MSPELTPTPNPAGGPRTPEGRAISSRNATTNGLYSAHDFIRAGEEPLYEELNASLLQDLAPIGTLECNLVDEIRRAMWRLRRCGLVEESFSATGAAADTPDPMQIESQARLQVSVDRARSQAHRLLHKCTAELRKFQTERQLRIETFNDGADLSHFGLCDSAFIGKELSRQTISGYRASLLQTRAKVEAVFAPPAAHLAQTGSFCKTARNAQCPCGSGQKYKRCCGRNAPAMQTAA
jgi:hypothetical protein